MNNNLKLIRILHNCYPNCKQFIQHFLLLITMDSNSVFFARNTYNSWQYKSEILSIVRISGKKHTIAFHCNK
jgi:uncharacterized protein (DUF779 family)